MHWRNLGMKNMLRNLRRYVGYLLAATLSVTVFAMFTNFVDNPAVRDAQVASVAREMLLVFRVLLALFAIFFVFFFHAGLIRARNNEFGLLLTFGASPRQIGRLIWYESLLMGLVALVTGIALGIVCAYVFQVAVVSMLALPVSLPFSISSTTVTTTGIFFGIVFLLEACWISWRVARRTPRVLLLGARTRQEPPKASWLQVLLGLLCIGAAYDMALQFSGAILLNMMPIIGLTIAGTYLLFSQCSVMLLKRLRRPGIPGLRLLMLARLSQRMRDYARMLTVVTVLNAVVLVGLGALYGGLRVVESQTVLTTPFALQLVSNDAQPSALTPAQVRQEIARHGLTTQAVANTALITGNVLRGPHTIPVSVMGFSNFIHLLETERVAHPTFVGGANDVRALAGDDAAYLFTPGFTYNFSLQHSQLALGSTTLDLQFDTASMRVLNLSDGPVAGVPSTNVVVVTDALYARLAANAPLAQQWQVYSYALPDWQQSAPVVAALRQHLPDAQQSWLTDTVTEYTNATQELSVMIFADAFLSVLFFLAAGSAIYLKLFAQQEDDRRQFQSLERIGFQRSEAARLVTYEFVLLFVLPIALAVIHGVVALLDLAHLLQPNLVGVRDFPVATQMMQAFFPVALLYLAGFLAYGWIARVSYLHRMRLATA